MSLRLTTACVAVVGIMAPDVVRAQNSGEPVNVVAPAGGAAPADGAAPAAAPMAPAGRKPLVSSAPPEPVAPAVITRDAEGNVTVRAVRAVAPIRVDGALDDRHYQEVTAMSDFIQVEPRPGQPATERTEIWVAFDDDYLYLTAKAIDSDMRLVATEMRRDSNTMFQGNDIVTFVLDPFYDRRNALTFTINPIGGRSDSQVANERQFSQDWNPVWTVKTARFDGYWTVEARIPFKSIRYGEGRYQVWGFNVARTKRSKNEMSTLSRVPPARGNASMVQMSFAATMVGLEAPRSGSPLDIKPYVTSSLNTNKLVAPQVVNAPDAMAGLDVKYAVTQGLSADFTLKTDFAQVEADEQQVNLTRFNLFFPEKREFFLENQGMFSFGGVQLAGNFNNNQNESAPIMFYSRRIGLNGPRIVPVDLGGRLTGRAGRYSIGVVNVETDEEDPSLPAPARQTNFSVVRLRRDVLRRSSIGLIGTGRTVAQNGIGSNLAYGADGLFAFYENLTFNTYWARTQSEGRGPDDISYRAQMDYNGDRYGLQLEHMAVGDDFNPEVGFLRRDNQVREFVQARFSPRPKSMPSIRRFRYQAGLTYIENRQNVLESRENKGEFAIEFQNTDQFNVAFSDHFEFLPQPFQIAPGIVIPVGPYNFRNGHVGFNLGRQRPVSTNASIDYGTFYNGHRTTLSFSQSRVSLTNALSVEPNYSLNKVDLVQGRFTTHLLGTRITYTMTPMMFVSALVQFNSSTSSVSTNARLRWEYQPGSELFVVYNEERNTLSTGVPGLTTRALIVKINRLFRY
jgi:hypothetical protein